MKKKTGPKPKLTDGEPLSQVIFTINPLNLRKAQALGGGNASLGVRRALQFAYRQYLDGKLPEVP